MDFLFDLSNMSQEEEFTDSKEDILKFLKVIGVDTRFVSYTPSKLYINNLRFSKFSRTREKTFYKHYHNIKVVRSSLFMKICSKASRILSNDLNPGDKLLVPENEFLKIILEPYTRKYGVKLIYSGSNYNLKVSPLILDDEVNNIFSNIFAGKGIDFTRRNDNTVYPLLTVGKEWILSFCESENIVFEDNFKENKLSSAFMEFLEDVAPQYRENVIKASDYLKERS